MAARDEELEEKPPDSIPTSGGDAHQSYWRLRDSWIGQKPGSSTMKAWPGEWITLQFCDDF